MNALIIPFLMTMSVIVALVWLGQIMKLSYMIEFGLGIGKFIFLTLAGLPTIALSTIPFVVTVACFFGYNYLYSDRELIAFKSLGFSGLDVALPALKLAAYITLFGYFLSFYFSPMSYHLLKNEMNYLRGNYIISVIHERTFDNLSKNVVLFVDEKVSSNKMRGVIMFDNRKKDESVTIFAKIGQLTINEDIPIFELYDGMRQVIDKKGQMNQMVFKHLSITMPHKNEKRSKTSIDLQEYTIKQLMNPGKGYSKERLNQLIAEKHQRFTWPGYIFGLAVLTLAIYLREPYSRTGHRAVLIKVALAVSAVLYLHFTFHNLASDTPMFNWLCYVNLFATTIVGWMMLRKI